MLILINSVNCNLLIMRYRYGCFCRLKLTRAPAPPGSDGSTESGRQRSVASKENNAADAVFHGIIYKRGVETNRWVELSRGFAKLMIRRDLTSRRGAIIVAQEGAIQVSIILLLNVYMPAVWF